MQIILFKCGSEAQFHFGKVALDENTSLNSTTPVFHSDTLFSAIVHQLVRLVDTTTLEEIIDEVKAGKMRLSSACFCLEIGTEKVFFLHKPVHYNLFDISEEKAQKLFEKSARKVRKNYRKIDYISKGVWEKGYCSPEEWEEHCTVINRKFLLTKKEAQNIDFQGFKPIKEATFPKVRVHHPHKLDSFYFQTNVQLTGKKINTVNIQPHYYFLLEMTDDFAYKGIIDIAINLLGDTGIGGGRSGGTGFFESVEVINNFDWQFPIGNYSATTGLLSPTESDLQAMKYYKTITRGGRQTAANGRLNYLRMMEVGAILAGNATGEIPDLCTKENGLPHLRFGKPICLPVHPATEALL